jgi:hypothetical protein
MLYLVQIGEGGGEGGGGITLPIDGMSHVVWWAALCTGQCM